MPYNFYDLKVRSDHTLIDQIRAEQPVYPLQIPGWGTTHWFLTRYEDANSFLRDPRFGRDLHNRLPEELLEQWPKPPEAEQMIERHLLGVDPPDHTRMRGLVHKAFTPKVVRNLEDRVREVADGLLNAFRAGETIDLVEEYAFPIPITMISEMLGVPVEDRDQFRTWVRYMIGGVGDEQSRMMAGMQFVGYMNERIAERRERPRTDVLSGMVMARDQDDTLSQQELISMIFLLLTAGFETTVHLIASGVYLLLIHPEQRAHFQSEMAHNNTLVNSTIEEIVRYEGPATNGFMRWAWEDVELGGQLIKQGDAVNALIGAANRDPSVFDNPHQFDITRNPNNHLGFGAGVHYCLGAPLARMEGSIALPMLLERFPDISLAASPDSLTWDEGTLHGLMELPVRLG